MSHFFLLKARTQEIRKKKEAEFDMLSSPVQGYPGTVSLAMPYAITPSLSPTVEPDGAWAVLLYHPGQPSNQC